MTAGNISLLPPEYHQAGNTHTTAASDMYAYGCLLLWVRTHTHPQKGDMTHTHTHTHPLEGGHDSDNPKIGHWWAGSHSLTHTNTHTHTYKLPCSLTHTLTHTHTHTHTLTLTLTLTHTHTHTSLNYGKGPRDFFVCSAAPIVILESHDLPCEV